MSKKPLRKLKSKITLGLDDYIQSKIEEDEMPPELPPQARSKTETSYNRPQDNIGTIPEQDYVEGGFDDYGEFDRYGDGFDDFGAISGQARKKHILPISPKPSEQDQGFYQEGSKLTALDKLRVVRWWKGLPEKEQLLSICGALTVAFLGLCAGIVVMITPKEVDTDLVLTTSKKTYELGDVVKIKEKSFINKKETDEEILESVSVYSTLFTDSSKYSYDSDSGIVKSRNKDYLNVGNYNLTFSYKKDGASKEKDVSIIVKDTKKPTFKNFRNRIYVLQGMSGVDLRDYFKATDKSGTVSISCDDSKVNLQTVGSYTMTVKARDASDNVRKKKCQVHVISIEDVKNGKVLSKLADGTDPTDATTAVQNSIQSDKNNEIAAAESAATEAYNNWQSLVSQANAVQSQINQLQTKKATEQNNLNTLKTKLEYAQSKLSEAESNGSDTAVIDSWKEQVEMAQKNYTTYSGQITDLSEIDSEVSKLNKQLLDLQKKASDAQENYNKLNAVLEQKRAS